MSTAEKRRKVARKTSAQSMLDNAPSTGKRGTYMRLPPGMTFFEPKEDREYRLLFLPWVSGKGNSRGENQDVENRFLFVHKMIGPNEESFTCLAKTSGKACPICEEFVKLRQAGKDYEDIKDLKFKNREFFLIHDLDGEKSNLQCWEESTALFGDFLRGRMGNSASRKAFASPDGGMVVVVKGRKKPIGKQSCIEFCYLDFVERTPEEQARVDKLLEKVDKLTCPDDWVIVPTHDKLKRLLDSTAGPEEDEDENEPEDEEDQDETEEEPEEPDDEESEETEEDEETEETDDEDNEPSEDDEESDEEDSEIEEEPEEEPEPAPPKKKKPTTVPPKKKGKK
jgi:hypothetical protein